MRRRPVSSTYRLQLRGERADEHGRSFTFSDATALIPYFERLGVSHLYLSPILAATPNSNHNYDVIDPTMINPELGGRDGFEELATAAHEAGLGIIVDIVPNHVGIDTPRLNAWWWDVLTYGQDSRFNTYFDIDWTSDNGADGRLGIPVLGSPDDVDKLTIVEVDDDNRPATARGCGAPVQMMLSYYGNLFPIRPGTESGTPQEVHDRQHYQLRHWKDGVIGYRRFFSVNGLAGIRQEDPVVFEHTHRVIRELIAARLIDGVRVDHPDGLADPFHYLSDLRDLVGERHLLLIEKILAANEPLDPRLAVDGTTGYDALREFDGVFVHPGARATLQQIASERSGSPWDEAAITRTETAMKAEVAQQELAAEIHRLARALRCENWSASGDDVSEPELVAALIEIIAAMPVYRADYRSLSRVTATVIDQIARKNPERIRALDFISAGLLVIGEAWTRFAQVCGAVMAKGVEDTTFYRACRLVALQEVGGNPAIFGLAAAEFHLLQSERAKLWPRTMTTLSTHDTKRSEGVRGRILEITEFPTEFQQLVHQLDDAATPPDAATCLFLLQNFIGAWPASGVITDTFRQRMHDYAEKAIREAGVHTTWTEINEEWEAEIHQWIDRLFEAPEALTSFAALIASSAETINNGRKLLQLLAPGIPDIYQGTEFPDDSLVDPDNRRFVDYHLRRTLIKELMEDTPLGVRITSPTGPDLSTTEAPNRDAANQRRLAVVATALGVRNERPHSFVGGSYIPVFAEGPANRHLIAFGRGAQRSDIDIIAIATRWPRGLKDRGGWENTTLRLPEGRWTNRFTGERFGESAPVATLLSAHPYAVLVRDTPSTAEPEW